MTSTQTKVEHPGTRRIQPACATSRSDRIFFAIMAVVVGVIAASMLSDRNFLCGIPATICTTFLVIGAITGWCPTQLFMRSKPASGAQDEFPTPQAYGFISIDRKDS